MKFFKKLQILMLLNLLLGLQDLDAQKRIRDEQAGASVSFKCSVCEYQHECEGTMRFHMSKKHGQLLAAGGCGGEAVTEVIDSNEVEDGVGDASVALSSSVAAPSLRVEDLSQNKYCCDAAGCGQEFGQERSFLNHKRLVHDGGMFCCNVVGCGKKYTRSNGLLRHKLSVHEGIRYRCEVEGCGKFFTQKGDLYQHKNNIHKETWQEEKEQKLAVVPSSKKRYVCTELECQGQGVVYQERSGLEAHMQAVHNMNLPLEHVSESADFYEVEEGVGGAEVTLSRSLTAPSLAVDGDSQKKYRCEEAGCGKKFSRNYSLWRHKLSVHQGKTYPCDVEGCGKSYAQTGALYVHMKNVHKRVNYLPHPIKHMTSELYKSQKILNLRGRSWSSADELKATVEKHTQLRELLLDFDAVVNGDVCEELIVLNPDLKILAYAVDLDEPECFERGK